MKLRTEILIVGFGVFVTLKRIAHPREQVNSIYKTSVYLINFNTKCQFVLTLCTQLIAST